MNSFARLLLSVLIITAALPVAAQQYAGTLAPGDLTLNSGEFYDLYTFYADAGMQVEVVLTSSQFDPYLIMDPALGERIENDDCTQGDFQRSCIHFIAEGSGSHRIMVTSFEPGETGAYELSIRAGSSSVAASTFGGILSASSSQLNTGEYVSSHSMRIQAGQRIWATLTSDGFDGYLMVRAPSGGQFDNDDCTPGDIRNSCLDLTATETGTWHFMATSYEPGETGSYQLAVHLPTDVSASNAVRYESGRLERGDDTLTSGEYSEAYTFVGTGGPVVVDLRSSEFDPYLIVGLPGGGQIDNDDFEGALDRSLVVVQTERSSLYRVLVTSFSPGETGAYDLLIHEGSDDNPLAAGVRVEQGWLGDGDERLRSGEYVKTYTFTGVPGQRIRIDLMSDDFDTYLLVQPPRGEIIQDDDGGGRIGHSIVEMDLTEPGTYQVYVTSFSAGESGNYQLRMDFSERFGDSGTEQSDDQPEGIFWQSAERYVADWTAGATVTGALSSHDARMSTGEYYHTHFFDGIAGQPIRIHLNARAFDTYLIVITPSGEGLHNDDYEGSIDDSVVEFLMPEDGRYQVIVTSYRARETGSYTLTFSQADALLPDPPQFDRIVGLFVGVSDYGGRTSDLLYTAQDAHIVYNAMVEAGMNPNDGVILTDAQATTGAFRQALRTLAARSDDRTMFVLFFSGHGAQYPRTEFQREDPDMLDESIELYDGYILDDELDLLLVEIPSRYQLIALDACFSGGFAKDLISRPGRMGLFSSEEDVLSYVAVKFEAGGYLSHFLADAIAGRQADEDRNGAITALELSHYLHERFRGDVVSSGREAIVARQTRPAHQKLVIDRGSVGLYETLFMFR